ncbi:M28 family peptidase [Novosphingobium pituita]|uniref:Carboxypeptidase Q n=1 Tax=Novosphingobium pituita TaxID=3056842 RepID=A0ABQ6P6I3_9SPHN|nr:M28 family peptidase [Novosphingobium sp. IK01]GMM60421.1 M28 family metallopeptidase [Novosphingobium sp. IK01]
MPAFAPFRSVARPGVLLAAGALLLAGAPVWADAGAGTADVAWPLVSDLTTQVGPRLAGSPAEARARDWAAQRLRTLGFAHVAIEPFTIRAYRRGTDRAELVGTAAQPLAVVALGYSGATDEAGITAPLAYFPTLAALEAAPAGSLAGKIAFIDHAMAPTQDGSGYGPYGSVRRKGPGLAASKGALAVVIRSVGTDHHRNPHTGVTSWPQGMTPIPAGALANPDADQIARLVAGGSALTLHLTLTGQTVDGAPSGNVVADLPGRDPSLPMVLVACHLDSWDQGTGAIDDGVGCAIVTAAALRVQAQGKPLRTIRVLYAGSEELGGFGGAAYAQRHGKEAHALAMESDFGADRVWKVVTNFAPASDAVKGQLVAALNPLGIVSQEGEVEGGTDVGPIIKAQHLPVVDLAQDGMHYFDLHHTPDDTLDKIDPARLEQNVAAWTRTLAIVANEKAPITAR